VNLNDCVILCCSGRNLVGLELVNVIIEASGGGEVSAFLSQIKIRSDNE